MALSNYSELQTAVANWLDRDDLTAQIPDFITLAEAFMSDDLRLRSMITEATVTPSQVNKYVDLPTGFKEPIAFVNELGDALNQVHHEDLQDMQYGSTTGGPAYYSITNRINFERLASGALSYTMTYYKSLDLATDTTNDVLTDYPNIYLYGTLLQAEPYLKNDKRINTWHQLYEVAMKAANHKASESLKQLRTDHPSAAGGMFNVIRGY